VSAARLQVDRERCMGSGVCQFWAPKTFALDGDCKSVVIDPAGDPDPAIQNAIDGCPTRAIEVIHDEPRSDLR
jgi:ferredoxin